MIDLDAALDANNPAEGAKWTLSHASGINDAGWITGGGEYDDGPAGQPDGPRAFLLDASTLIPEPSSLGLIGIIGVGLLMRQRRSSDILT